MSYDQVKSERYALFGGLNTKISRYLNGPQELIRLVNYDHSQPGSLTKRPDTASFLGASFGSRIDSIYEFNKLNGASWVMVAGFSGLYAVGPTVMPLYFAGISLGGAFSGLNQSIGSTNFYADFETFYDTLWIANLPVANPGTTTIIRYFAKWGQANTTLIPDNVPLAQMQTPSGYVSSFFATMVAGPPNGTWPAGTGYRYSLAYENSRGIAGTPTPFLFRKSIAIPPAGATTNSYVQVWLPFGASPAIYTDYYRNDVQSLLVFRETIGYTAAVSSLDAIAVTTAIFRIGLSALVSGVTYIPDDLTPGASYLLGITAANYRMNEYFPFGLGGSSFNSVNFIDPFTAQKRTGYPSIISKLNNMMFFSGFSTCPSHVFWSELETPEWVANDSFAALNSDDGDFVTAHCPYNGVNVIGKRKSIFVASGFSPDDISIDEKTTEYGIINKYSTAVYNALMWFIDGEGKGICQFDGANFEIISANVEDIFKRINLTAAFNEAFMLHVKQRNEIWAGIPVDGSSLVNVIVVFDYFAKAWTTYEGLTPTAVAIARSTFQLPTVLLGQSGAIRSFNATFTGSEAVTAAVRFPYVTNFGWSTEQVFRRFFLDVDPILGISYALNLRAYANQGNSASINSLNFVSSYQPRFDFGVPAKSLSFEVIEGSTLPLRVNGYTVTSRFQRNV